MMHRAGNNPTQELDRIYDNLQPEYHLFTRRQQFDTLEKLTILAVNYEVTRDRDTKILARVLTEACLVRDNRSRSRLYNHAQVDWSQATLTPWKWENRNRYYLHLELQTRVGNPLENRQPVPNFWQACGHCAQQGHFSWDC